MDLQIGPASSRELTVDESTVEGYARITRDYKPLHFDADFARRTRFGRLMAQEA